MKKMVMAVVPRDEADHVLEALISAGFTATFVESRGGMLRQAQKMLFTAIDKENLQQALDIIRDNCRVKVPIDSLEETRALGPIPVSTELGGAVVFVWTIDSIETY